LKNQQKTHFQEGIFSKIPIRCAAVLRDLKIADTGFSVLHLFSDTRNLTPETALQKISLP